MLGNQKKFKMTWLFSAGLAFCFCVSVPQFALADLDRMNQFMSLGQVVGAAEPCEYGIDQSKLDAILSGDMEPLPEDVQSLQMGIQAAGFNLKEASVTARKALCSANRGSARRLGILAD